MCAGMLCAAAQAQVMGPRATVQATGQASVFVQPDQVKIDASVVTMGTTAQDAAARNADQVAALTAALTKLLGSGADIKTVNYFVGPNYRNGPNGGPPVISGFTASNTVEVTLGNLTQAGTVIDTAVGAGATSIGGLQFSLKDSEPAHLQALRMATAQAKTHADAMAGGLGRATGAVISLQEQPAPRLIPIVVGVAAPGGSTMVTPGLIEVQATVALVAELT